MCLRVCYHHTDAHTFSNTLHGAGQKPPVFDTKSLAYRLEPFAGLQPGSIFQQGVSWADRPKDSQAPTGHAMLSEANADRLANALCRMRGAALKLGTAVIVSLGLVSAK